LVPLKIGNPKYIEIYFLKNFFLPYPASPINPDPRRSMVEGSGTGLVTGEADEIAPTASENSRDVDSYSALLIFRSTLPYGLVYG
jgi:hypothetical protein